MFFLLDFRQDPSNKNSLVEKTFDKPFLPSITSLTMPVIKFKKQSRANLSVFESIVPSQFCYFQPDILVRYFALGWISSIDYHNYSF